LKEGRILTHCSSASEAERPLVALHPAKPNNAKIAQFDGMRNEEDMGRLVQGGSEFNDR
jgi:hypothetical protein